MNLSVIGLAVSFLAGMALASPVASAEPTAISPPAGFAAPAAADANTLGFQLLPARFRREPSRTPGNAVLDATVAQRRYAESLAVDYRDRAPLVTRLRELDGLRLLTFWETKAFALFFGVSRSGIAGLNISQKKDRLSGDRDDEETNTDSAPEPTFLAATAYRDFLAATAYQE